MFLSARPQGIIERIALWLGLVPMPLLHTQGLAIIARTVLAAANAGLFEHLNQPSPAHLDALANGCKLHPEALGHVLPVLQSLGYLNRGVQGYSLTRMAKRFCIASSPHSILPHLLFFEEVCWPWLEQLPDYLQTGAHLHTHSELNARGWGLYQAGMASLARQVAPMAMGNVTLKNDASRLLDIGGAHGLFSAALLERYPNLAATILELPGAAEASAKGWVGHVLASRIKYLAADALTYPLPADSYDVVLISGLLHHLEPSEAVLLVSRAADALAPGGKMIVQEFVRPARRGRPDLAAGIADLFFAISSGAQNYSKAAYGQMLTGAGLRIHKVRALPAMPAVWQWQAVK